MQRSSSFSGSCRTHDTEDVPIANLDSLYTCRVALVVLIHTQAQDGELVTCRGTVSQDKQRGIDYDTGACTDLNEGETSTRALTG